MIDNNQQEYPFIDEKLIQCLENDYPNILPTKYVDEFELGRLMGQQDIIYRLKREKEYQENEEK